MKEQVIRGHLTYSQVIDGIARVAQIETNRINLSLTHEGSQLIGYYSDSEGLQVFDRTGIHSSQPAYNWCVSNFGRKFEDSAALLKWLARELGNLSLAIEAIREVSI